MKSFPMMSEVQAIECHYIQPGRACAFLICEGGRAAFVDNNTTRAVPYLLQALRERGMTPEQVEYAIVTHVHLDHAGGTAALLAHCPNATVLCHPKAARHLASPARLVAGSKQVYGEELFARFYGEIVPVDASRIRSIGDGEVVHWGARALTFMYTLGHATHHVCIFDAKTNTVFAGDNLGICYPALSRGRRPYIFAACTPSEYDPGYTIQSLDRILATGATHAHMNHFGTFELTDALIEQFRRSVERTEEIIQLAADSGLVDTELRVMINGLVRKAMEDELRYCGLPVDAQSLYWIEPDIALNSTGLSYSTMKRRQRRGAAAAQREP
jgi:glyoxylase-like metal-dependent hydrolase (beta-lactamase superfamily II)